MRSPLSEFAWKLLIVGLILLLLGYVFGAPAPLPRRGAQGPAQLGPGVYDLFMHGSPCGALILCADGEHVHEDPPRRTAYRGLWSWDAQTRTLVLVECSNRIGSRVMALRVVLDWRLRGTTEGDYGECTFQLRRRR